MIDTIKKENRWRAIKTRGKHSHTDGERTLL